MSAQRQQNEVIPVSMQSIVNGFLPTLRFIQLIKKAIPLHYSTLELFLCIIQKYYVNGQGCSLSNLLKTLYSAPSASITRGIRYRLATLLKHGLIYSVKVGNVNHYFLSDKAKGILEGLNKEVRK